MPLTTSLVNVGLTANDGAGDDLRAAFIVTNNNINSIQTFLTNAPDFAEADITLLTVETLLANVANVTTLTANTSTVTGNAVVTGNINVSGNIVGNIISADILAGALDITGTTTAFGDAIFAGNSTGITGNLTVAKNVQINGNLKVLGNVVTISTSEYLVEHPTIELGRIDGATLTSNDGNDLGIEFVWYDSQERKGFFGFDNSSEKFVYIPRASWSPVDGGNVEVFSGALGTALFSTVEANVSASGASTFNTVTANSISVSAGITGNLVSPIQANITSVGTLTSLAVTGGNVAVTNGNINISGPAGTTLRINGVQVSTVDANFTGGSVPNDTTFNANTTSTSTATGTVVISGSGGLGVGGNLHVGGNLTVTNFSTTNIGGTLTTASQPNITAVGTLTNLTVTNTISGNVNGSAATVTSASQPNITSVGTLTDLTVTNAISGSVNGSAASVALTADNSSNSTRYPLFSDSATGNVSPRTDTGFTYNPASGELSATSFAGILTGSVSGSAATVTNASQPNITSVGSLTSLTVVGTTTFGGNVNASSATPIGSTGSRFGTIYATSLDVSSTATAGSVVSTSGNIQISTTGKGIKFADGTLQTSSAGGAGGSTNLANVAITVTTIADDSTNAVNYPWFGNVTSGNASPRTDSGFTYNPSTGDLAATSFTGIASSAKYADLAERYESDQAYEPGTVLIFGGEREVTTTNKRANVSVAGVVSTAPAYLMNKDAINSVPVALRGKVPVKVIGPVRKGDLLVTSSVPGYAECASQAEYGIAVFAKSLEEDLLAGEKIITAVII